MSDVTFVASPFQRSIDAMPIRGASVEQLDLALVQGHLQRAIATGRYHGPCDVMAYLEERNCIITFDRRTYVTLTGLLCFGHNPQELFPQAVIDLCRYRNHCVHARDLVHAVKGLGGTVFQQIARITSYLTRHTFHLQIVNPVTAERIALYEYPPNVIKELTVNLIAHRDYTEYASVAQILLFRDRIEWINPGGLLSGITPENLILAQHSRNPNLMRILYDSGHVDAFGQGIDTVFSTLRSEEMADPLFINANNFLTVRVFGRSVDAILDRSGIREALSMDQQQLLAIIRAHHDGIRANDLREQTIGRAARTIQRDIKVLMDLGLVVAVGATRSLRYKLIDKDDLEQAVL